MVKISKGNAELLRMFDVYLKQVDGKSESTLVYYRQSVRHLIELIDGAELMKLNRTLLLKYKERLREEAQTTNKKLSSLFKEVGHVEYFLKWLIRENKRIRFNLNDVGYLKLKKEEMALFASSDLVDYPDQEEIIQIFNSTSKVNDVEWRNRIAFILLNSVALRKDALQSLTLKCFNMDDFMVYQHPKLDVNTKHSTTFDSNIYERIPNARQEIKEWIEHLYSIGFTDDSPIVPATKMNRVNNLMFTKSEKVKDNFIGKTSVDRILKDLCRAAGTKSYSAHKFRHALCDLILECGVDLRDAKVISHEFGHKSIKTIINNYAPLNHKKFLMVGNKLNEKIKLKVKTGN